MKNEQVIKDQTDEEIRRFAWNRLHDFFASLSNSKIKNEFDWYNFELAYDALILSFWIAAENARPIDLCGILASLAKQGEVVPPLLHGGGGDDRDECNRWHTAVIRERSKRLLEQYKEHRDHPVRLREIAEELVAEVLERKRIAEAAISSPPV